MSCLRPPPTPWDCDGAGLSGLDQPVGSRRRWFIGAQDWGFSPGSAGFLVDRRAVPRVVEIMRIVRVTNLAKAGKLPTFTQFM
jgi:hypothetical protein